MTNDMTFLDFFSGIGGFRKGFELCGMTCKGHCEIDKFADRSYRAIYDIKEDEWYGNDITKVNPAELPRVNLWSGGFPCQDISVSGQRKGLAGKRSSLFFEFIRLLKGTPTKDLPEWLVLENVKNLLSVNQGWDFATILNSLAESGYNIEYGLLNSRFHGVPQNRERIYLVAYRHFRADGERKVFPVTASDGKALIQLIGGRQGKRVYDSLGVSCTLTSEGGGLAGKTGMYFINENDSADNAEYVKQTCMSIDCPNRKREIALIKLKQGDPKIQKRDYIQCLIASYNKNGINNRGENSGVFYGCHTIFDSEKECGEPSICMEQQTKTGEYLCACDSCEKALPIKTATKTGYQKATYGDSINLAFPNSKTRRGRVGKGYAQTLDTSCNQGIPIVGCGRIRKLTPRECWRLQGFSDDMFDKAAAVNSDSQLYKQAGNSVTIPVVYAVGKRIIEIQDQLNQEAINL